jgi:hypothetical protein
LFELFQNDAKTSGFTWEIEKSDNWWEITFNKKDILSVLFYNMRMVNLNLQESTSLVIDKCLIYRKKARIPTHHRSDCIAKYKKLYEDLRTLSQQRFTAKSIRRQLNKHF